MEEEQEKIKKDRIEKLIEYVDDLKKIKLTDSKLKEAMAIVVEKLESLQLAMGRTFKELNESKKGIDEEFDNISVYFDTPIYNPVKNYINSVERYMTEKQQETGCLFDFIVRILGVYESIKKEAKEEQEAIIEKSKESLKEDTQKLLESIKKTAQNKKKAKPDKWKSGIQGKYAHLIKKGLITKKEFDKIIKEVEEETKEKE